MTDNLDAPETAADITEQADFAGLTQPEFDRIAETRTLRANQLTPWTAGDYSPIVRRSGATKLASSGVAPLIVAARGYESVAEEQSKDFAKRWGIGDGRTKRGTQFLSSFRDDGDILVMPWFSVDQQVLAEEDLDRRATLNLQIRPQHPRVDEKSGKPVKYEFLVGSDTVLDYHPAVTREWASSAPRIMLSEGLLKGDSALTALLRSHVSDDDLAITDADSDRLYAMRRLARLLDAVPAHERVAIVSLAGVGNWRSNQEWAEINMKEKEVLVAFDGDVESNWNVWNMAKQMFDFIEQTKKGQPLLVVLSANDEAMQAMFTEPKLGLDDFFHHVGHWADVESMIVDTFPERPEKPEDKLVGDWRVSRDGNSVEECVQLTDTQGNKAGVEWQTRYLLGGRVLYAETLRGVTDEEMTSGIFGVGVDESKYGVSVAVEVKWRDEISGQEMKVDVTGPHTILGYPPNEWDRRGAVIPKSLMFHKQWPPKKGLEWLSAIKGNDQASIEDRTTWSTMGWVPVPGEKAMAFIVGNTIIAPSEEAKKGIRAGVGESELTGSRKFGVADVFTGPNYTDPDGRFNLVDDIHTIVSQLLDENSPWKSPEAAAAIVAMALRPSVPIPNSVACYLVGPPAQGKSWTARQIMSFWQTVPGSWKDTLPGSANDTFAAVEGAVARAPIWVADDLAPSSDRRKAEAMETAIGDLIRAVFNKLGKRRMNFDLTAKEVPTPMALLILTAENEHPIQSIRERVVNIEFNGLRDETMEAAELLAYNELTASRVNGAIIRMFIKMAEADEDGWDEVVSQMNFLRTIGQAQAKAILGDLGIDGGDVTRPAGIIADLALGLLALGMLADELGMTDLGDKFTWDEGGYIHRIAVQVSLSHKNKSEMAPGQVLLDSVSALLASGYGHIANIDDPTQPPVTTGDNPMQTNAMLGWQVSGNGDMRPRGVTLGWYTHVKTKLPGGGDGEPTEVIVLAREDAFNEAQRRYPKRIQFGSSQSTSWKNVWDRGLVHPLYISKRPATGVSLQFRAGRARISGIPVSLDLLFPEDKTNTEAHDG